MKITKRVRQTLNRLDPLLPPTWALIVISALYRKTHPGLSVFFSGAYWGLILAQFLKIFGDIPKDFRMIRNLKRESVFWAQLEKASEKTLEKFAEGYNKAGLN